MYTPLDKSPFIQLSRSIPILSSKSIRSNVFAQIIEWWREKYFPSNELKFHWTDLHISIVGDYFSELSSTCVFRELPSAELLLHDCFCNARTVASFTQELQELFVVPRQRLTEFHERQNHRIGKNHEPRLMFVMQSPNEFDFDDSQNHGMKKYAEPGRLFMVRRQDVFHEGLIESQNRIQKNHLLEGFISFLLRLLYHRTDPIVNRIDNLEKKLRFLLTILGHTLLMMFGDEDEEFQKLLAEFEAVANEAGGIVHWLIFSTARAFWDMDEAIGVVLNHIVLLRVKILEFYHFSRSTDVAPNSSVVDSVLIVDSLIDDLKDMMEDNRISDVKNHIETLYQGLISLQSFIKDVGSPLPSEIGELKEPLMRIGDVAHEAEYLIISFLVGDAPIWFVINRLLNINNKISIIGAKLQQDISEKYKFGGLKDLQLPLLNKRNTRVNDVIVGWEDKATPVLELLVGGTERLQVISIFGMPGLGKTTLANKLYNHPLIRDRFDKKSWSVVSQNYRMHIMLTEILININGELDRYRILNMEEEALVVLIHKTLKGRRFLIVMDDIWDLKASNDLQRCFPDDGNGSRILLTTRNKDVSPPSSVIYPLPFLSNDQCWELLEKKVFGSRSCPPELEEIGKKIAANCYGLPLAVVVIAGILSTVHKEESKWEEVGGSLASYILDGRQNSVMLILELSYKHLPDHLKPCFLYFAAFEEDKEISVRNLMRLWNAEGFIRRKEEKSAENIGEEYLAELIDKCLVMVAKRRSDGGVKTCVLHDLLRDLCLKKSEEENFLKILKSEYQSTYGKGDRIRALGDSMTLSYCQHVRSFYGSNQTSPFYVRDMRLLRVLRFDHIHHNHFIGIEYLVNLRYLVITNLPASIGSLVNLEYLCVETSATIYLPPTIANMVKLRYLHVLFPEYCKGWSNSNTNNLEFLSWVSIRELKDEDILKCSPRLRKLKCRYELRSMEKWAYPFFDLRFLTKLDSLNLAFHHSHLHSFVLPDFTFPSNIRKLTLSDSRMCWENMSTIGILENLEILKLRDHAFEGERWDTREGEFQKLRFLQLEEIPLIQWNVYSSRHFPRLQRLVLDYCNQLLEIPSEIGEIETLQLIEVQRECQESMVESAKRIQQEQLDMGNEELRVVINTTDYMTQASSLDFSNDFILEL